MSLDLPPPMPETHYEIYVKQLLPIPEHLCKNQKDLIRKLDYWILTLDEHNTQHDYHPNDFGVILDGFLDFRKHLLREFQINNTNVKSYEKKLIESIQPIIDSLIEE